MVESHLKPLELGKGDWKGNLPARSSLVLLGLSDILNPLGDARRLLPDRARRTIVWVHRAEPVLIFVGCHS